MRKILLILASLCVVNSALFAADATTSDSNQFVAGSYIDTTNTSLNCRPLKSDKYKTQIVGYDFMNGIIKCAIIPNDTNVLEVPRSENANRLHTQATFEKYYNDKKTGYFKKAIKSVSEAITGLASNTIVTEKVELKEGSTLSSYLSGLAVLNGMDADSTADMKYLEIV